MSRFHASPSTRAIIAGAICLAIVGGMLVGYAWPLWTGRDVMMAATVTWTNRNIPGEHVRLGTAADFLRITPLPSPASTATEPHGTLIRVIEPWTKSQAAPGVRFDRRLRGRVVYVQLEANANGDHVPVSVSLEPVPGAMNLRGIVAWASSGGRINVRYGLNAFYMQEGHAKQVEKAANEKRHVQMKVAIAQSGRARIRELLVDGVPVQ
jgi:hypothetical protein